MLSRPITPILFAVEGVNGNDAVQGLPKWALTRAPEEKPCLVFVVVVVTLTLTLTNKVLHELEPRFGAVGSGLVPAPGSAMTLSNAIIAQRKPTKKIDPRVSFFHIHFPFLGLIFPPQYHPWLGG